jgi:hypothetical protein
MRNVGKRLDDLPVALVELIEDGISADEPPLAPLRRWGQTSDY